AECVGRTRRWRGPCEPHATRSTPQQHSAFRWRCRMDRGIDFLKSQINNAVMQHKTFVENLDDHASQADDERFRELCRTFLPKATAHQQMLEDYQQEIGAEAGLAKKALGKAMGMARDLADAPREGDFLRLVGDIVTAR